MQGPTHIYIYTQTQKTTRETHEERYTDIFSERERGMP